MLINHLNSSGLVSLMSEKHRQLRDTIEKMWEEQSDIKISYTEWYIMYKIYGHKTTISEVTRNVTITRQATHKNIKSLKEKGLVEVTNSEHSKRDKCVSLTTLGEHCCIKNEELRLKFEEKVAQTIGQEKLNVLKDILQMDWGI